MSGGKHREIELKYLIRYPDIKTLQAQKGVEQWEIVQMYLTVPGPGETRRIRQVVSGGEIKYYKTFKRRLSNMSNEEDEGEIRIPYQGHVLEFDIYPFWTDRAILEIELEHENEGAALPEYVRVIRDVSADYRYKNRQLAENVVMEEI